MNVLFDCNLPFQLAHGGMQTQIEQTLHGLRRIGTQVEMLRWWDADQNAQILHYFGRPHPEYLRYAKLRGMRTLFSALLGGMGARSPWKLALQFTSIRILERVMPKMIIGALAWDSFRMADTCVAVTPWEAALMRRMFRVPENRVQIVPNGVEDVFFAAEETPRGKWLITTASILPVKRIVETGEAAIAAKVPWWVIGKPFSESDPYYQRFLSLCRQHPDLVRYEGHLSNRTELARAYRQARGFVMLSRWESLSVSALEAAASGCPLLLADLPWARSVFGERVRYCKGGASKSKTARVIREFYDEAPSLKAPPRPPTWDEVAEKLQTLYIRVSQEGG